jgi:DeoD family purine-nucleoside phosphorylase
VPIHLRVSENAYAETVLLVGDPGRARTISSMLQDCRCVNENRGLLGYTGTHNGLPISVQTTGMGCPSAAIVVEELLQLKVQRLIRIGTCGGIGTHIKPCEMIAAVSAAPFDGTTSAYLKGKPVAPYATFRILKVAADIAEENGISILFSGIASVDVFYNPFPDYVEILRKQGIVAVEMETSLIYYLANRSGVEAASFLLVSDIVGGEEFTKFVTDDDLQKGMNSLISYVLQVCSKL